jgi:broad specificity phosphatase PhoE
MSTTQKTTTRLLLARHGQTQLSLEEAFCGITEAPLTPVGQMQARHLAERLRKERIDALYCSPQQRALQTAEPIAAVLGLEIQQLRDLREMDFGFWEGWRKADLETKYAREMLLWEAGSWQVACPGGETQQEVIARGTRCLQALLAAHVGQTLLIVAHRTLLRLVMGHVLEMSLPASRALAMGTASLSELWITDAQTHLVTWNDTRHLSI